MFEGKTILHLGSRVAQRARPDGPRSRGSAIRRSVISWFIRVNGVNEIASDRICIAESAHDVSDQFFLDARLNGQVEQVLLPSGRSSELHRELGSSGFMVTQITSRRHRAPRFAGKKPYPGLGWVLGSVWGSGDQMAG